MKLWRSIKNHLLPWRGNTHRPHILRRGWLLTFLALTLVSEGIILGHALVTPGPQVFLAAVLRSDVISYTDEARVKEGGQHLTENDILNAAAQAKAEDMAARGYFSHVGPDGEEPWVWLERAGYDYMYAGENLAVRFEDSKDVVDAWMASPTHRANIVKPAYQEVGVGLAEGIYKEKPATFVVQYFGAPAPVASHAPVTEPEQTPLAANITPTPTQEVPAAPAQESSVAGAETEVAAVQAAPTPKQSFIQSATRAVAKAFSEAPEGASWVLAGVTLLLVVVLALTFFIRIQVQPTDLLLPGMAVALIAVTFMAANSVYLSTGVQSASVADSGPGDIGIGISTVGQVSAFPEATDR